MWLESGEYGKYVVHSMSCVRAGAPVILLSVLSGSVVRRELIKDKAASRSIDVTAVAFMLILYHFQLMLDNHEKLCAEDEVLQEISDGLLRTIRRLLPRSIYGDDRCIDCSVLPDRLAVTPTIRFAPSQG